MPQAQIYRFNRWLLAILATPMVAGTLHAASPSVPARVVSANLCTDQLALLLAAPGQLLSVSALAADPTLSNMAPAAIGLPLNRGRAEEIFALSPDLVVAGTYTTRTTVDMLRRLGVRVELFTPDASLDDSRAHIRRMGELLGRQEAAQALLDRFDADRAALTAIQPGSLAPLAASYDAGGRSAGRKTLFADILYAGGWRNLTAELGVVGVGSLPLERLIFARPDLILSGGALEQAPTQAQRQTSHPALAALRAQPSVSSAILPDRQTLCGGPAALTAAQSLARTRQEVKP